MISGSKSGPIIYNKLNFFFFEYPKIVFFPVSHEQTYMDIMLPFPRHHSVMY